MAGPVPMLQVGSLPGFCSQRLERVFADCFESEFSTRLIGGADEPVYLPGAGGELNRLYYRDDFFASALHEVSHWCIAGERRRTLTDFGYWYAPEGRNRVEQQQFESVEVKPQALEWFFSLACNYRFALSVDNLDPDTGALPDIRPFAEAVHGVALRWREAGLPARAQQFFDALSREFGTALVLSSLELSLDELVT